MGFEDLFEHQDKHRHHGRYGAGSYVQRDSAYRHNKQKLIIMLLNKIWSNKKLKIAFIIVAVILVLLFIFLIVALIPLIFKLLDYIAQNGIQGVVDSITNYITKLWKGSGN